jgi:uncharacterized cupin superfamily protein
VSERPTPAVPEADLGQTGTGLRPRGPGWFVVNLKDAAWMGVPGWGRFSAVEPPEHAGFDELGIGVHVLEPGERNGFYHGEDAQEGFLVLSGECLLLVEGREQRLKQWDFVHAPRWTRHIFVGAGDRPCAILMVGARAPGREIEYPVEPVALRHAAGVERATMDPDVAYADTPEFAPQPYTPGDLA